MNDKPGIVWEDAFVNGTYIGKVRAVNVGRPGYGKWLGILRIYGTRAPVPSARRLADNGRVRSGRLCLHVFGIAVLFRRLIQRHDAGATQPEIVL